MGRQGSSSRKARGCSCLETEPEMPSSCGERVCWKGITGCKGEGGTGHHWDLSSLFPIRWEQGSVPRGPDAILGPSRVCWGIRTGVVTQRPGVMELQSSRHLLLLLPVLYQVPVVTLLWPCRQKPGKNRLRSRGAEGSSLLLGAFGVPPAQLAWGGP